MSTEIKCYRGACDAHNACCHHTDNGKLYCPACARKINEAHNPKCYNDPTAVKLVTWPIDVSLCDKCDSFHKTFASCDESKKYTSIEAVCVDNPGVPVILRVEHKDILYIDSTAVNVEGNEIYLDRLTKRS